MGPDLLQLSQIAVGKKLETEAVEEHHHWYENPWLWAATGLLLGILLMYLIMKNRYRKVTVSIIIFLSAHTCFRTEPFNCSRRRRPWNRCRQRRWIVHQFHR